MFSVYHFSIIFEHDLASGVFTNPNVAYKFALTMPCTQVTCKKVFFKLKIGS